MWDWNCGIGTNSGRVTTTKNARSSRLEVFVKCNVSELYWYWTPPLWLFSDFFDIFRTYIFKKISGRPIVKHYMVWCPDCTTSSRLERKFYANSFHSLIHGNLPNAKMDKPRLSNKSQWSKVSFWYLIVFIKKQIIFWFYQILENCSKITCS